MNDLKINALLASSYNLHVGPQAGGEAMTPAKAAALPKGDRAALAAILRDRGGSDLYTKKDAQAACLAIVGPEPEPTDSDDNDLSP